MPPITGQFASVSALLEALTPPSGALGAAAGGQGSGGGRHAVPAAAQPCRSGHAPPQQVPGAAQPPPQFSPRVPAAQSTPLASRPDSAATEDSVERKLQAAVASFFQTVHKAPPPALTPAAPGAGASSERIAALSSLAKRQQRQRLTGRPNRAADQRGGGGGARAGTSAVCYA